MIFDGSLSGERTLSPKVVGFEKKNGPPEVVPDHFGTCEPYEGVLRVVTGGYEYHARSIIGLILCQRNLPSVVTRLPFCTPWFSYDHAVRTPRCEE